MAWGRWAGLLAVFVVAVGMTAASSVAAQDSDDTAARRAYRLGEAHYQNGEFAEAGPLFEEAYHLSHRPQLLFNAYVAYRDAQDLPNSARLLRMYLTEGTDIDSTQREQLTARLAVLERVVAPPPTTTTTTTATTTETHPTATTETHPTTTTETHPTTTTTATASETTTTTSATAETTTPETTTTTTTTPQTTAPTESGGGGFNPSPVGFIVGGVGVAMIITGIVTGVMAQGDRATLDQRCMGTVCPEEVRSVRDEGQTLAIVTDVMLIGGIVAAGVGTTLLFVLQDAPPGTSASAACTPTGCYAGVQGRF